MRGPIRGVSLHIAPSWPPNEVKHLGSALVFFGGNSEQTVKQPKGVFPRLHRTRCLNAVPGYWCKIAEHCKQILFPVILFPVIATLDSTWKESNVVGTFQSISSLSLTRDRVISILALAIIDVVEFRRVLDRIKPIP